MNGASDILPALTNGPTLRALIGRGILIGRHPRVGVEFEGITYPIFTHNPGTHGTGCRSVFAGWPVLPSDPPAITGFGIDVGHVQGESLRGRYVFYFSVIIVISIFFRIEQIGVGTGKDIGDHLVFLSRGLL